ncbi:hypothetical protein BC830DRAFT_1124718 [Chytriomyces sp. MP71]|nr:hypothetical protein BC830DRAFT_1124718 [Chytriomyces sp. MP71]
MTSHHHQHNGIFAHWDRPSLPDIWQVCFNRVYLLQSILLIGFCALRRKDAFSSLGSGSRWVNCGNAPAEHWVFRQYSFMLFAHIVYYGAELLFSAMWSKYTIMAMHHVFGIAIVSGEIIYPNSISVLSSIPLFIHNLLWALNSKSLLLVYVYNVSLIIASSFSYFQIIALDPASRPVSTSLLHLLCISIFFNNYFFYCYTMEGQLCLRSDPWTTFLAPQAPTLDSYVDTQGNTHSHEFPPWRGTLTWAVVWWGLWLTLLHMGAWRIRDAWRRSPPSFAIAGTSDRYQAISSEDEELLVGMPTKDASHQLDATF